MKAHHILVRAVCLLLFVFNARATVFYVDINSPNPTPPYASWGTASTDIQSAIDASSDGDQIWVNDGVYQTGGRVANGSLTNRVVINKAVTVQSVNGPGATSILGYQMPTTTNGDSAVRCVYMTNNASLIGFTIAFGATGHALPPDGTGGGVWCENTNSYLSNCILTSNAAFRVSIGVYQGTLNNCTIANGVGIGPAANESVLNDCLVTNTGGMTSCVFNNCVLAGIGPEGVAELSTLNNCTVVGNHAQFSDQPILAVCSLNNCIVYYNLFSYPDCDTCYFSNPDCIGCYITNCCVYSLGSNPSMVNCFTNPPVFVDLANSNYRLTAGSPCVNRGTNISAPPGPDLDGNPRIIGASVDMGAYEYQSLTTNNIHYVNSSNTAPIYPYTSWDTASTDIQSAIDASVPSDLVLVTNGVYQTGGRTCVYQFLGGLSPSRLTNRVDLNQAITVQSVNGPGVTSILGYQVPGTTNGTSAIRCIHLVTNATLVGFTLAFGATTPNGVLDSYGGGAWCDSTNSYLFNCILTTNSAGFEAGIYQGTLTNCTVTDNIAVHAYAGAFMSVLNNCTIANNINPSACMSGCVLNNCLLNGNSPGGVAVGSTLSNCTVVGNYGSSGMAGSLLNNCVIYYNNNGSSGFFNSGTHLANCCVDVLPNGAVNCFTNPPGFVDMANGDYRLSSNSPCINAGNNALAVGMNDLDGHPRIVGGTVDLGAYEYQSPLSVISYAYLQQYGLPTDGSVDFVDSDGDGMNNWQEWKAGTDPTSAASVLQMASTTNGVLGTTVTWQSVPNVTYLMQRSSDLSAQPPFLTIQSNLVGQVGTTTSYMDTTATNGGPYFYRVGVQ